MAECKKEENLKRCPCTYTSCGKMGMCCDCLLSHLRQGELPGCCFPEDVEATYDRSIERFVETYRTRGPWW